MLLDPALDAELVAFGVGEGDPAGPVVVAVVADDGGAGRDGGLDELVAGAGPGERSRWIRFLAVLPSGTGMNSIPVPGLGNEGASTTSGSSS